MSRVKCTCGHLTNSGIRCPECGNNLPEDESDHPHVRRIKQGVQIWNEWRERNCRRLIPNLAGAYLVDVALTGADLSRADLRGAEFGSTFDDSPSGWREYDGDYGGHLENANLRQADLSGAHLYSAWLTNADLSGA